MFADGQRNRMKLTHRASVASVHRSCAAATCAVRVFHTDMREWRAFLANALTHTLLLRWPRPQARRKAPSESAAVSAAAVRLLLDAVRCAFIAYLMALINTWAIRFFLVFVVRWYLRFGFDGLQFGHVVRRDVALLACFFAARQPPVALDRETEYNDELSLIMWAIIIIRYVTLRQTRQLRKNNCTFVYRPRHS